MAILTSMAVGAGGKIIDEVIGQVGADRRLKKNEAAQKRLNEHQKELDFDLWQKNELSCTG